MHAVTRVNNQSTDSDTYLELLEPWKYAFVDILLKFLKRALDKPVDIFFGSGCFWQR